MKTFAFITALACISSVIGAPVSKMTAEADALYRGGAWGKREAPQVEADALLREGAWGKREVPQVEADALLREGAWGKRGAAETIE
jgi:hypothetical protein